MHFFSECSCENTTMLTCKLVSTVFHLFLLIVFSPLTPPFPLLVSISCKAWRGWTGTGWDSASQSPAQACDSIKCLHSAVSYSLGKFHFVCFKVSKEEKQLLHYSVQCWLETICREVFPLKQFLIVFNN